MTRRTTVTWLRRRIRWMIRRLRAHDLRLRKIEAFIASRHECPRCRRGAAIGGDFPCESGCEGYFDEETWKPLTFDDEGEEDDG